MTGTGWEWSWWDGGGSSKDGPITNSRIVLLLVLIPPSHYLHYFDSNPLSSSSSCLVVFYYDAPSSTGLPDPLSELVRPKSESPSPSCSSLTLFYRPKNPPVKLSESEEHAPPVGSLKSRSGGKLGGGISDHLHVWLKNFYPPGFKGLSSVSVPHYYNPNHRQQSGEADHASGSGNRREITHIFH